MGTPGSHDRLNRLFLRLSAAGLAPDYVRRFAFPAWWDDEIASDEAGFERALGLIHRTLGVSIDELWDPAAVITCPPVGNVHFKHSKGVTEKDFEWARNVGVSAAGLALEATPPSDLRLPSDPAEIRQEILAQGYPWVDLHNLLDYLWARGIPVLHIDEFPGKKMAGLATKVFDRPAIVLSKRHPFPSLMLFDLGHETGHVANGDLAEDDVVLDESIEQGAETDPKEVEATRSGLAILTGNRDAVYKKPVRKFNPISLEDWARAVGNAYQVSPGVVAQNWAFHTKKFAAGMAACQALEPNLDPVLVIRQKMVRELHLEDLSPEEAHFLVRVAGEGAIHAEPS